VGKDFGVCMSPEFLREGKAVHDFMNPIRIIIGEFDRRSGDTLLNLYQSFNAPVLRTDLRTAEMIKLASNTFLTMKISFINEIGNICKKLGIDSYEVAKGMGFDDRIGRKFLNAGIGFGGSCLPKDLRALIRKAKGMGYEPKILEEVLNLNERQALKPVQLLQKHVSLKGSCVGLLGLAFKPGTNDVRASLSLDVIDLLEKEGAIIRAHDPKAIDEAKKIKPEIEYYEDPYKAIENAEALIILTGWPEFKDLDFEKIKNKMQHPNIIDGRNLLSPEGVKKIGFNYLGIGTS